MADAKDYLELWRERYSFPSYIGDNFRLSEDGTIVLDNEKEWSEAQRILLQGSAVGTSKNSYLDPKPLFNKLGEIYTNIINSSFASARTDSIKMNRNNMDYTNGSGLLVDQTPVYPFFCFLYGMSEETSSKDVYNDWYNENVVIDIISAISENNNIDDSEIPNIINIDSKLLKSKTFPSFVKTQYQNLRTYLEYYTRWYSNADYPSKFSTLFNEDSEDVENFWKKHWYCIRTTDTETSQELEFYLPNEKFVEQFRLFKKKMLNKVRGLQLLMPQYHRRVEVEDLDENFWVISVILDAVVNALWGPYGLIDVVRQLILKVTQIEDFLGLSNLTGIELLYNGKDELYFDMYSRFLLSGLELKLKTQSGERIIKNIFESHTEYVNRNSTTDGYDSREELFFGIQTNEIDSHEGGIETGTLYDSDIISSDGAVEVATGKKFISLSAIIDAINDEIKNNKVGLGSYDYNIGAAHKKFFQKFDITPDGTLSPGDLKRIAEDNLNVYTGETLSAEEMNRFYKYASAKDYLLGLLEKKPTEESDEYKLLEDLHLIEEGNIKTNAKDYINNTLFKQKKVLLEMASINLDNNNDKEISSQEYLNYANNQINEIRDTLDSIIATYYVRVSGGTEDLKNLSELEKATTKLGNFINLTQKDLNDMPCTLELLQKHCNYLDNYFLAKNKTYLNIEFLQKNGEFIYIPYIKSGNTLGGLLKININTITDIEQQAINKILPSNSTLATPDSVYYIKSNNKNEHHTWITNWYNLRSKLEETYENYNIYGGQVTKTVPVPVLEVTRTSEGNNEIKWNSSNIYVGEAIDHNSKVSIEDSYHIQISLYDEVAIFPSEDIYVYYLNAEKIIGTYILPPSSELGTTSAIQQWFENYQTTAKTFFDINQSGNVDIYDAIDIENNLTYINDAKYNKTMKDLITKLDNNEDSCVEALKNLLVSAYGYKYEEVTTETIKQFLFIKKSLGSDSVIISSDIITPTNELLILIASLASPERMINGYEIDDKDKEYLLQSTKVMDYKLYGNILIFLYDEDYYKFSWHQDETDKKIQDNDGLYVKVTDGFYTTKNPIIKYNNFYTHDTTKLTAKDDTYALFIPRADLIGGEIIQLRLTEKGKSKKMLNLNSKTISENGFVDFITSDSKLFLSLHNSFADNLTQYNHRTTLFFDDTTPENVLNEDGKSRPFTCVDDWFCNGIECQYFKPNTLKIDEKTVTGTRIYKHSNLKIKASMICKNEEFKDNSFIFEAGPTDNPSTNDIYYTFTRQMAYSAAQRNNLIFYSSPATIEDDMFIHSPTQLLLAPSLRKDESIQPPYWEGQVDSSDEAKKKMRGAHSVMLSKNNICKIADIKNMIYRNSLVKEHTPPMIEAVWGMRNVDNYIKKKILKYIIIEREPGSRNSTYGPNCIDLSCSDGYLHDKDGMKSLRNQDLHNQEECRVKWYNKEGQFIPYKTEKGYFPPGDAKYGVIDLTGLNLEETRNFIVRFYSSNLNYADSNSTRFDEFTFQLEENGEYHLRRPIFKMAYFLGVDSTGKSTTKQDFLKKRGNE